MTYKKTVQSSLALIFALALFVVSFTSNAAGLPEENVEPISDVNPVSESAEVTMEIIEKACEEGEKTVEEQKKKAAEFEASKKLLAALIFCEAGNQPYKGQVAVGAVVLNRVRCSSFPNSISGVIYQSGAFDVVADGQINMTPDSTAKKAASDALNGWDPSYGSIYYFNPNTATNDCIWSRPHTITIGKHRFCKWKG